MQPAAVFSLDSACLAQSEALAGAFGLPVVEASGWAAKSSRERLRFYESHLAGLPALAFLYDVDALQLALIETSGVIAIRAGFHGSGVDYRRAKGGGRSEMIARAVGLKGGKSPNVLDATAGLGVDAFVLASLGCTVTMLERVPAVSALLQDGLARSRRYAAEQDADLADILGRLQFIERDAAAYLDSLGEADLPDVVYLDPMFPERKKSAAVKKEMQLFHQLIGPDDDAGQLLESALGRAQKRVVVKRPRIASPLSGREPSHVLEGKRNRYDIYLASHLKGSS
ncbi:MAG: class I SAM-dependent methyltransferase [Opitutales bacterium]